MLAAEAQVERQTQVERQVCTLSMSAFDHQSCCRLPALCERMHGVGDVRRNCMEQ
jgi:hypothetical protein